MANLLDIGSVALTVHMRDGRVHPDFRLVQALVKHVSWHPAAGYLGAGVGPALGS
jgi:hypothetical protein